jgi:segregation and condensation protein B
MELESQIESILFFKAEPVSVRAIASALGVSEGDVKQALTSLKVRLEGRGVRLVTKDDVALLTTAPEASRLIEGLLREELQKELGKAGLETLTIVLYKGPLTGSQIDYIRGVNSTYIIRHLLTRGLVEKIPNPGDRRSYLYRPSFELLSFLGIGRVEDLPEYEQFRKEMLRFSQSHENEPKH